MLKSLSFCTLAAVLYLVPQNLAVAGGPSVVVSINPLHSLVAGVMQGVASPMLLLTPGKTPHSYAMRPSQAQALNTAQLVVWIGPELETFLRKPIEGLPRATRILSISKAPGIQLLKSRNGGPWAHSASDAHSHGKDHEKGHGAHGVYDMHLWLDPENAKAAIRTIKDILSEIDPANAQRYSKNARTVAAEIEALTRHIEQQTTALKTRPYIVFHDAFQYFERRFGLTPVGAVTINPDRKPGAKRIHDIRRRIVSHQAQCVFREPQFAPRLIETLAEDTGARIGLLDPLGSTVAPGPAAYAQIMRNLSAALSDCLTGKH